MKLARFALAVLLSHAVAAFALPQHSPVPGGVAVIDLGPAGQTAPTARWGEQAVAIVRDQGRWLALLGIPLDTLPGDLEIAVFFGSTVAFRQIAVRIKNYPEQRLRIKDRRKVEPNPDDLARIEREKETTDAVGRSSTALIVIDSVTSLTYCAAAARSRCRPTRSTALLLMRSANPP